MSRRSRQIRVAVLAAAPIAAFASFAGAQTVYTGANNGDFNTATNWSAGLPTTAVDARINAVASNVTVLLAAGQTGNVRTLTIDSGDALQVGNNSTLNIAGNLVNAGSLKFLPVANNSILNFSSATAAISGAGILDLNYAGGAVQTVIQTGGGAVITNTSTIRGSGYFNDIHFVNAVGGVLESYQTAGSLYLDALGATGSFVNNGTIRALAGATVSMAGDNGGDDSFSGTGIYRADGAGAIVRFINDAVINGGNYQTANGGEIVVEAGHTGTASSFNTSGTFRVRNNARLNVSGTITNTGTINVTPVANESYLTIVGDTTLTGTGTLLLNSTASGGQAQVSGPGLLTIGANQTIHGDGFFNDVRVVNNGTIIGDDSTALRGGTYLDAFGATGSFVNNGTIQVTANNYLSIVGDNGGDDSFTGSGTYRADGANAFLHLANDAYVIGGTYTTTAGGEIRVPVSNYAHVKNPTITAGSTMAVLNNSHLYANGTITNAGTLEVRAGANETYLTLETDTTFAGAGQTILTSNPVVSNAEINGTGLLTINAGYTVRGNGYLDDIRVVNNGLIVADKTTGSMYLDANGGGTGGNFINNATIQAVAGATLNLAGDNGGIDSFTGNGVYRADGAGAFLNLINGVELIGGTVTTTTGGVVQVPASQTAYVTDTTISAGSQLTVANNARLYLAGSPIINGVLQETSGANESYITINGIVNLNVGTLSLTSNPGVSNARLDGTGLLTIGANFTVSGNGYFADDRVVNNGTIVADRATGTMYIDSNGNATGGNFVNNGTIKATAGATLTLSGENGSDDRYTGSGNYRAEGTGAVFQLINSAEVIGGTFGTTGTGRIRLPASQTAYLTGSTLTAGSTFETLNDSRLYVNSTFANNGTLSVTSAANETYLSIQSDTTFSGTGTTRLISNPGSSNARIDGAGRLTIGSGYTVAGNGYFYDATVTNNGLILADQPTGNMYLDSLGNGTGGNFVNNATIQATTGATITLAGENGGNDTFTGAGTYRADGANAQVQLINDVSILGGTFTTTAAGVIRLQPSQTGTLQNPTISTGSTFESLNSSRLYINTSVVNNGTFTVKAPTNETYLSIQSDTVLSGTGVTRLSSSAGANARIDGAGRLTIAAGHTLAGNGLLYDGFTTNNGTILADQPTGSMYIDANGGGTGGNFVNNGTIKTTAGATLNFAGDNGGLDSFTGAGTLVSDGTIQTINGAEGDLGAVTGAGTVKALSSSTLGFKSLRLTNIAADGGTLRITTGGGNAGTSKVNTLAINTANSGRIDVADHGIVVDYAPGNSPRLTIRNYLASGRNGGAWNGPGIDSSLANSNGKGVGYGEASDIYVTPTSFLGQSIDSTSVLIRYTLLGDTNLDGGVNFDDLLSLAQNYNTVGKVWTTGDFTYDGAVNFDDLLALAQNYNLSLLSSSQESTLGSDFMADYALAQSLVPEPTSLSVLLGLTILGRRRRTDAR